MTWMDGLGVLGGGAWNSPWSASVNSPGQSGAGGPNPPYGSIPQPGQGAGATSPWSNDRPGTNTQNAAGIPAEWLAYNMPPGYNALQGGGPPPPPQGAFASGMPVGYSGWYGASFPPMGGYYQNNSLQNYNMPYGQPWGPPWGASMNPYSGLYL